MRFSLFFGTALVLSSGFLAAQAGTFTIHGKGCPGTGASCISANWTNPFAGNIGLSANYALPVNTGSTNTVICGIELKCKTQKNRNVNMRVWIYDSASTGAPGKILRSGIMPVTGTTKANRANFSPLVLAKNTRFFIVLDNSVGLNLPIMSTGTRNAHYWKGPPSWRGPFTTTAWNYNVICCATNPIPKIGNTGVPTVGKSFSIDLSQVGPNAKILWIVGIKRTNIDLTFAGAPNCFLLTDPLGVLPFSANGSGELSVQNMLPNNLSLVGFVFDTQFAVKDSVNALGLVFSAGGEGKVGK